MQIAEHEAPGNAEMHTVAKTGGVCGGGVSGGLDGYVMVRSVWALQLHSFKANWLMSAGMRYVMSVGRKMVSRRCWCWETRASEDLGRMNEMCWGNDVVQGLISFGNDTLETMQQ